MGVSVDWPQFWSWLGGRALDGIVSLAVYLALYTVVGWVATGRPASETFWMLFDLATGQRR